MKNMCLVLVAVIFLVAGCAGAPVAHKEYSLDSCPKITAGMVVFIEEVKFYHDWEAKDRDGRIKMKGDADTSREYQQAGELLRKEFVNRLQAAGFGIVDRRDHAEVVLRIYGVQKNLYLLALNHLVGALVEGWNGERYCFSYSTSTIYNNVAFKMEKAIQERIAFALAQALIP